MTHLSPIKCCEVINSQWCRNIGVILTSRKELCKFWCCAYTHTHISLGHTGVPI